MKIAIYLNNEHPRFAEVQDELAKQLEALDTIKFKKDIKPAKPGTLGIPGEVVGFFANHYKDVVLVVNGIIGVLSYIDKRRSDGKEKKETKKKPPSVFVLVVGDQALRFPSSQQSQKRFLAKLQTQEKEEAKGEINE
jgi:hypothetical protein